MELVVLSSDSDTRNGCDRVILADDRVVVQGVTVLDDPEFASVSVPAGETLTAISVRIFIEAARLSGLSRKAWRNPRMNPSVDTLLR